MRDTSWEVVAKWYDSIVDKEGHYYHKEVIFPNLLNLMHLTSKSHVLDIGCGTAPLSHLLPKGAHYTGVDLSQSLLKVAKEKCAHQFIHADATEPFDLPNKAFTHATCVLALQNMVDPESVFRNVARHLKGSFFVVMNHPCFRIPRQSSWGIDEKKKLQYRRMDRYMSPLEVPIAMHPGKGKETTTSFHRPISTYTKALRNVGMQVVEMHEWCSNKISSGKMAKMENRARQEFPLFLTIEATCAGSLAT